MKYWILLIMCGYSLQSQAQLFTQSFTDPSTNTTVRSHGVAMVDVNGDDNLDLFTTAVFNGVSELFVGDGAGAFTNNVTLPLTQSGGFSEGVSWADYDNDGDLDCFIANHNQNNQLFRNDSNQFTEITTGEIVNDGGASRSGVWGDYNNDGCIDLYVTNQAGQANFLYHNKCDGSFQKMFNSGPLVTDQKNSIGCAWSDLDYDGDVDLVVGNHDESNSVYRNDGGTFVSIDTCAIALAPLNQWYHGISIIDIDNDRDFDVFIGNYGQENLLYRNEGNFHFVPVISTDVTSLTGHSTGSVWFDYDNDADQDLFVSNDLNQPNWLYENDGFGGLTLVVGSILLNLHDSRAAVTGDVDSDGDQDLYVANEFTENYLFLNNGNANNWINIRLVGAGMPSQMNGISSRCAIGAKVSLKANINGSDLWQVQEITGQTGYLGQGGLNAEFGLADATIIDSVIVEWPGGLVCYYENVGINQHVVYEENCQGIPVPVFGSDIEFFEVYPNPSTGQLSFDLKVQGDVTIQILGINGAILLETQLENSKDLRSGVLCLPDGKPSGLYLVRVITDSVISVKRVIVSR